jgi:glycosyltransferase involved in cell wall biosynthesis
MKELVSIIIPAYNAQRWIGDCITSALRQTWKSTEIIIVDDGSTDATFHVAERYASLNLKVVSQPNQGACAARNHALSLAQGSYIQWLDADDLLASDKIERQMAHAGPGLESDVLISGAWGKFYRHHELAPFRTDALWQDMSPGEWLFRKLDQNLWMPPAAFLVSRKLTEDAGAWDETLFRDNDGEYFCRLLMASSGVHFVEEARIFKRVTFGISSNITLSDKKLTSLCTAVLLYTDRLLRLENSARTIEACLKLLNRWAVYFFPERPDLFAKLEQKAVFLGGHLSKPRLRKKYRMAQRLFGWQFAKKLQNTIPAVRVYYDMLKEQYVFIKTHR